MESRIEKNGRMKHYEIRDIEETLTKIHGSKYAQYRKEWHSCNDTLTTAEKPLYISVEVNTYCNLKCKMCPSNFYTKNKQDITRQTLDRLVSECKKIGLPSILLTGEPLMSPYFKEILTKIKSIGAVDNFLITNGTLLDQEAINLLIDCQFERCYFSLDAAFPETYKRIRGADLNLVESNIKQLLETRKEHNSVLPLVRVSFVKQPDNINEMEQFLDKWKDKVDIIDFQELIDYSEIEELKEFPEVEYRCSAPFTTLSVNCEGDIFPCCTAYTKYLKLGNINENSLMDVWQGEKLELLRNDILNGTLPLPCQNCAKNIGK